MEQIPKPWIRRRQLAGDASSRSYFRLWDGEGHTAVLVCYPEADRWQLERDLLVRAWCMAHGLRVPALVTSETDHGWAVYEDLGPIDAEQCLHQSDPATRLDLARRAVQPLVTLAELTTNDLPAWNRPLDETRLRWELAGFELWYIHHDRAATVTSEVGQWLDDLARAVGTHPQRICHRDYHLNNLFFDQNNEVVVIDYQDILVGPDTYDAVSLICERGLPRELSESECAELRHDWARITAAAPGWSDRFRQVRIQRGLKVLGTFARLSISGADGYRKWMVDLRRALVVELEEVAAPVGVIDLLLD